MSFCHCYAISQVKANCSGRGMSARASAQPQGCATSSPHPSQRSGMPCPAQLCSSLGLPRHLSGWQKEPETNLRY